MQCGQCFCGRSFISPQGLGGGGHEGGGGGGVWLGGLGQAKISGESDRAKISCASVSLGVAGRGGASSRWNGWSAVSGAGVSSTGPFSTLVSAPGNISQSTPSGTHLNLCLLMTFSSPINRMFFPNNFPPGAQSGFKSYS